jgi:hypothetical protein
MTGMRSAAFSRLGGFSRIVGNLVDVIIVVQRRQKVSPRRKQEQLLGKIDAVPMDHDPPQSSTPNAFT